MTNSSNFPATLAADEPISLETLPTLAPNSIAVHGTTIDKRAGRVFRAIGAIPFQPPLKFNHPESKRHLVERVDGHRIGKELAACLTQISLGHEYRSFVFKITRAIWCIVAAIKKTESLIIKVKGFIIYANPLIRFTAL